VVVPLVTGRLLAVLDRLLRAPLQAGEALFAPVAPDRSISVHGYVSGRADLHADPALVALVIRPELTVHPWHHGEGHLVEGCEEDALPERPFFDR